MGLWDVTKSVAKVVNPFEFSPADMLWNGAKLGYHAFTDPTDTLEHRAERRMHINDDIAGMIPIYGGLVQKAEQIEDVGAYWDRWMNGKSDAEAPTSEERKMKQMIETQPADDEQTAAAGSGQTVEQYRAMQAQQAAEAEERRRATVEQWSRENEQGRADKGVSVDPTGVPSSDPVGVCE